MSEVHLDAGVGHEYVTVVADLERARVHWVGDHGAGTR